MNEATDPPSASLVTRQTRLSLFLYGRGSRIMVTRGIASGLPADSSTGERCVNSAVPERRLAIRRWLLSLRCDCITMVQPAESRQGLNLARSEERRVGKECRSR